MVDYILELVLREIATDCVPKLRLLLDTFSMKKVRAEKNLHRGSAFALTLLLSQAPISLDRN